MMMLKKSRGFTLIEVMIVVAIIAIIVAVGYPSYREQVKKSRRAEGMGELLELADRLERSFSDQGTYAGATASGIWHSSTAKGFYNLTVQSATAIQFEVRAAPTAKGDQNTDKCGTFTLTSLGEKNVTGGSLTAEECWK